MCCINCDFDPLEFGKEMQIWRYQMWKVVAVWPNCFCWHNGRKEGWQWTELSYSVFYPYSWNKNKHPTRYIYVKKKKNFLILSFKVTCTCYLTSVLSGEKQHRIGIDPSCSKDSEFEVRLCWLSSAASTLDNNLKSRRALLPPQTEYKGTVGEKKAVSLPES